jgi:hypothetical protein
VRKPGRHQAAPGARRRGRRGPAAAALRGRRGLRTARPVSSPRFAARPAAPRRAPPERAARAQGTTDYGHYLQNEPSPIVPATIVEKCTAKLVEEWNHLRCQARARLLG